MTEPRPWASAWTVSVVSAVALAALVAQATALARSASVDQDTQSRASKVQIVVKGNTGGKAAKVKLIAKTGPAKAAGFRKTVRVVDRTTLPSVPKGKYWVRLAAVKVNGKRVTAKNATRTIKVGRGVTRIVGRYRGGGAATGWTKQADYRWNTCEPFTWTMNGSAPAKQASKVHKVMRQIGRITGLNMAYVGPSQVNPDWSNFNDMVPDAAVNLTVMVDRFPRRERGVRNAHGYRSYAVPTDFLHHSWAMFDTRWVNKLKGKARTHEYKYVIGRAFGLGDAKQAGSALRPPARGKRSTAKWSGGDKAGLRFYAHTGANCQRATNPMAVPVIQEPNRQSDHVNVFWTYANAVGGTKLTYNPASDTIIATTTPTLSHFRVQMQWVVSDMDPSIFDTTTHTVPASRGEAGGTVFYERVAPSHIPNGVSAQTMEAIITVTPVSTDGQDGPSAQWVTSGNWWTVG